MPFLATARRLGMALALSLLLHLALAFGPSIRLPEYRPAPVLEATLIQAPPTPRPAPAPAPAPRPKQARHFSPPPVAPAPDTLPEAASATDEIPPPLQETTVHAEPVNDSIAEPPVPLPEHAVIRYTLHKGLDGITVGRVEHEWHREERRYSISQVAEASGIFSLFIGGKHVQVSQGEITPQGMKPHSYWVQRGQKADKTDSARFDWLEGTLTFGTGLDTRTVALPPGTQDLLSFLYQLAFNPPQQGGSTELHITTGRKLGSYGYQALGEETLDTELGAIKALHIGQGRGEGEENTEIWLATEYHYLPVKIRFTDKQGSVMEQTVTAIKVP